MRHCTRSCRDCCPGIDRLTADAACDPSGSRSFQRGGGRRLGHKVCYAQPGNVPALIPGATTEFDGTAPLYGIGASFKLFGLGVRAEYETMDVDELEKSDSIWVSVFYEFF